MKKSTAKSSTGAYVNMRRTSPHAEVGNGKIISRSSKSSKTEVELFAEAASAYSKKTTRDKQSARAALYEIGIITKSGRLTARYK